MADSSSRAWSSAARIVLLTATLTATLGASPAHVAHAQSSGIRTWCNPVDIDYKYDFEQQNEGISYRSGADPVIVVNRGAYYLFETIAGGWWRSTDLVHWTYVRPTRWPVEDIVAPAVASVGDTIIIMQSSFEQRPLLYTTSPATGQVGFYNRWLPPIPGGVGGPPGLDVRGPWDPDLFHDEDTGRWFLYWGSSNKYPIYGIELDPRKRLDYVGQPRELISLHPDVHGWERFGRDHGDTITPYIEGAWMTKHAGTYYLQYAAPGTEYNVYANGTYVGATPFGPFTYAPNNPVSYRPGGFAVGAGHGNTFRDLHGNWWNTGTTWIGRNWNFERRIVMYPAGFDEAGDLYADTRFGDFPHYAPTRRWQRSDELFTGWMLLSYRKPAIASSTDSTFVATNVTDENPRTLWVARTNTPREWLRVDLGRAYDVRALQVDYGDYESGIYDMDDPSVYTRFRIEASTDGVRWTTIADLSRESRDRPNAYVELAHPVRARFIRYDHIHVGARHLAISDIRVFGSGSGPAPATPAGFTAERERDRRNARIAWRAVPGAVGYNVRWGLAPDRLWETYQRWGDEGTSLELRALSVDQHYWVAIEAFDENGVSRLSTPIRVD